MEMRKRKGDEVAAMPMYLVGLLVVFLSLLAGYFIFMPVVNGILVPIAQSAIDCLSTKGVSCLIEGAASSLGGG